MLGAQHIDKHTENNTVTQYATGADFCRIFKNDMNRLYLLSFLLTADDSTAQQCFVLGLEDSKRSNPVFKGWAESWARRMIITNAIRVIQPRPDETISGPVSTRQRVAINRENGAAALPKEIANILELPDFDRFVFVLRVLEGYSDRECSLLLGCTVSDLSTARVRIFQEMATSADLRDKELRGKLETIDSGRPVYNSVANNPVPEFAPDTLSHLAATA